MNTYLLNIWDTLRTSFWFVPSLMVFSALVLSVLLPWLDTTVAQSAMVLPEWILTTTSTARATLSALMGAMMTVTGTVFSITIVTLSLTSQQFGPRLLRRFMYDLPTQVTLGVFLATGFYSLLVLRVVENQNGGMVAPHLSVFAAIILAVLSMAMLIVFIHHVAMLIQAPQVVAAVASDLANAIERLFPEKIGDAPSDAHDDKSFNGMRPDDDSFVVRSNQEGYIQAIDGETLMRLACKHDLVLRLLERPGRFVVVGAPLAEVWSGEEELAIDSLIDPLNRTIITGNRRTPRQDVECAIDELVEVAVRALSTGINDPFTAINCIDRLGAAVGRLAERKLPHPHRYDQDARLRVITQPTNFAELLDAAFSQIRQYGCDSVAVTIRLLDALQAVHSKVQRLEDREAVLLHAKMVVRLAEDFTEQHDRNAVIERFEQLADS